MATIKSYTDIEQSKKLAKILSVESADGGWYGTTNPYAANTHLSLGTKYSTSANFPAWSLTALLNMIPNYKLSSEHNYHTCTAETSFGKETVAWFDNPVDACVAMIEKLNELNLL